MLDRKQNRIKIFKNGNLIWDLQGKPNLITKFYSECGENPAIRYVGNHVRIGVYPKSDNPNAANVLHFDDFVSGPNEEFVDSFLN